jgi:heterodisulfide reductase subunit B
VTGVYAFFRGCFIPSRASHIEYVARKILPRLGVELVDVSGFTCCPEPTGFRLHEKLTWLTMAARNIAVAEEQGHDILTLCNGCYYTLKQAVDELENKALRSQVNEALADTGHQYIGKARVRHFIQVLTEEVGVKRIEEVVKRPLEGLRVAAHTGCHFSNRYGLDAKLLDQMVQALGATSVDYELKNLCCGWMISGYGQLEEGYTWLKNRLESMRKAEADCVTVICPQCYQQYDTGQMMAARKVGIPFKVPALFYLQLLGLAMGYSLEEMQYGSHRVRDSGFEEKVRKITAA